MTFKSIFALTLALLVIPGLGHAENVVKTETLPSGHTETTILKGYKVKSATPVPPSRPVAGQTYYSEKEVYIPATDMNAVPPSTGTADVQETEHKILKPVRDHWTFND